MNNEDMSDIMQKLSSMIGNFNNSDNSCSNDNSQEDISSSNTDFNIDFETIFKIKNIMDAINSNKTSQETNLLMSLKPYLNNNRKKKLDQYVQFLNIAKILEAFNSNGEVNQKWFLTIKKKLIFLFSF